MRSTLLVLAVVATLAVACGYRPIHGSLPPGLEAIHVPSVGNETPYGDLAGPLTSALRKRLARSGVRVVGPGARGARLEVGITGVQGEPGMLTTNEGRLAPVDTIWKIRAEARLVGPGNQSLAETVRVERRGRAFSGGSVRAEEALGQRQRLELLDDLADAIVTTLFES